MGMMNGNAMDPKKKAIEELLAHLDKRDGMDLGDAMKPKGMGVEVTEIKKLGDGQGDAEPDGDESPGISAEGGESKPEMSDEEMAELIEALQSKLGA